jgi:hypothetical protein
MLETAIVAGALSGEQVKVEWCTSYVTPNCEPQRSIDFQNKKIAVEAAPKV